jgi:hypothetical protein
MVLGKTYSGSGHRYIKWNKSTMANLTGPAPHIGEKEVKRILKLDLSRADADVVLRSLMGAAAELGPTEEFLGQMRKLELVGKAAGLRTFKGVIGLMEKVLSGDEIRLQPRRQLQEEAPKEKRWLSRNPAKRKTQVRQSGKNPSPPKRQNQSPGIWQTQVRQSGKNPSPPKRQNESPEIQQKLSTGIR